MDIETKPGRHMAAFIFSADGTSSLTALEVEVGDCKYGKDTREGDGGARGQPACLLAKSPANGE
jgi:hypothetical protein